MPGRPKTRRDLELLEDLPEDMVFAMFEAGKSTARICEQLGIGRRALEIWCDMPENEHKIARARARAADVLACQTLEIADQAAPEESNLARVRIQTRQWVAERWKPGVYAQQRGPAVNISIGGLRLDALRHVEVVQDVDNIPRVCG